MTTPTLEPGTPIAKDPDASKTYTFDWTDYLTDLGQTISASTFAISGPDAILTKDNDGIVVGNLKTQLRLIGGTLGATYVVTNHITTNGSPATIDDRSIFVNIVSR